MGRISSRQRRLYDKTAAAAATTIERLMKKNHRDIRIRTYNFDMCVCARVCVYLRFFSSLHPSFHLLCVQCHKQRAKFKGKMTTTIMMKKREMCEWEALLAVIAAAAKIHTGYREWDEMIMALPTRNAIFSLTVYIVTWNKLGRTVRFVRRLASKQSTNQTKQAKKRIRKQALLY